jgi:hypothetical protein
VTLLDSLFLDVVLTEAEELAQFGTHDEESAGRHGACHLEEE